MTRNILLMKERCIVYYGLFVRVGQKFVRVDGTTGYTLETAQTQFAPLMRMLRARNVEPVLKKLPPVRQLDPYSADKKYAKTPW